MDPWPFLKVKEDIFKNLISVFLVYLKRKVIAVIVITLRDYNDIHGDISKHKGIYDADAIPLYLILKKPVRFFPFLLPRGFP